MVANRREARSAETPRNVAYCCILMPTDDISGEGPVAFGYLIALTSSHAEETLDEHDEYGPNKRDGRS